MQVGNLVKWRRNMFKPNAPVGIVTKKTGMDSVPTAWWSVLWSNGKTEIVSERNLLVVNHASG